MKLTRQGIIKFKSYLKIPKKEKKKQYIKYLSKTFTSTIRDLEISKSNEK